MLETEFRKVKLSFFPVYMPLFNREKRTSRHTVSFLFSCMFVMLLDGTMAATQNVQIRHLNIGGSTAVTERAYTGIRWSVNKYKLL